MVGKILFLLIIFAGMGFAIRAIIRGLSFSPQRRGSRIVTCPETKKPAAVEVAVGAMSSGGYRVLDRLRLDNCSRWPLRQDCGQECL